MESQQFSLAKGDRLVRAEDVCVMLDISNTTLRNWVRDGRLKRWKVGARTFRYKMSDINKMFQEAKIGANEEDDGDED